MSFRSIDYYIDNLLLYSILNIPSKSMYCFEIDFILQLHRQVISAFIILITLEIKNCRSMPIIRTAYVQRKLPRHLCSTYCQLIGNGHYVAKNATCALMTENEI